MAAASKGNNAFIAVQGLAGAAVRGMPFHRHYIAPDYVKNLHEDICNRNSGEQLT